MVDFFSTNSADSKYQEFILYCLLTRLHRNVNSDPMNEVYTPTFTSSIVAEAGAHMLTLYNKQQNTRLLLHNYAFAQSLVTKTGELGEASGASKPVIEVAQLAAWFLNIGHLFDYVHFLRHSIDQAQRFLALREYPEDGQRLVLRTMQTVGAHAMPTTLEEKLLADATSIVTFIEGFEEKSPLLRLEQEFMLQQKPSKEVWTEQQLHRLLAVKLHTHYAKTHYEPILAQCIHSQKRILEKIERNQNQASEKSEAKTAHIRNFQDIDESPARAIQTFFRTNYRNHINLSSIADNKANIMISVNSILISVLISILSYRNYAETNPQIVLPIIIFLVTGLASLIFAVLSARPKITALNHTGKSQAEKQQNLVFFGNFVSMELEEYEAGMDAIFRDGELLYGNLVRDLYHLGKVLEKKYRYLTVSYNIFMIGFVTTVLTFLVTLFI